MAETGKKVRLQLTEEQTAQLSEMFGSPVRELNVSVRHYDLQGSESGVMRVLRVDNIAMVQGLQVDMVVN